MGRLEGYLQTREEGPSRLSINPIIGRNPSPLHVVSTRHVVKSIRYGVDIGAEIQRRHYPRESDDVPYG